jgi:hypothetical protein
MPSTSATASSQAANLPSLRPSREYLHYSCPLTPSPSSGHHETVQFQPQVQVQPQPQPHLQLPPQSVPSPTRCVCRVLVPSSVSDLVHECPVHHRGKNGPSSPSAMVFPQHQAPHQGPGHILDAKMHPALPEAASNARVPRRRRSAALPGVDIAVNPTPTAMALSTYTMKGPVTFSLGPTQELSPRRIPHNAGPAIYPPHMGTPHAGPRSMWDDHHHLTLLASAGDMMPRYPLGTPSLGPSDQAIPTQGHPGHPTAPSNPFSPQTDGGPKTTTKAATAARARAQKPTSPKKNIRSIKPELRPSMATTHPTGPENASALHPHHPPSSQLHPAPSFAQSTSQTARNARVQARAPRQPPPVLAFTQLACRGGPTGRGAASSAGPSGPNSASMAGTKPGTTTAPTSPLRAIKPYARPERERERGDGERPYPRRVESEPSLQRPRSRPRPPHNQSYVTLPNPVANPVAASTSESMTATPSPDSLFHTDRSSVSSLSSLLSMSSSHLTSPTDRKTVLKPAGKRVGRRSPPVPSPTLGRGSRSVTPSLNNLLNL